MKKFYTLQTDFNPILDKPITTILPFGIKRIFIDEKTDNLVFERQIYMMESIMKAVDDILDFWKTPEGQKDFDRFANSVGKKLERKRKKNLDFFESEKFNHIIKEIKRYLKTSEYDWISDNEGYERYEFYKVTHKQFIQVFNSLFEKKKKTFEDPCQDCFPTQNIKYKGLVFQLCFGQGTSYSCCLEKYFFSEERKKKKKYLSD